MATTKSHTPKRLYGGAVSTASTWESKYTVPTGVNTIVKNIVLCNYNNSTDYLASVKLNGIIIVDAIIKAQDTVVIDLSSIVHAGESISIFSDTTSGTQFYISGVEVS